FPDHPHRGFEAITLLLEGELRHTDNMGHDATLRAGEVQAFTAGHGLIHAEMVGQAQAADGLQLWINLPRALKGIEPAYQPPVAPRRIMSDGYEMQLVTGPGGPIQLQTPTFIALLDLAPGFHFTPDVPPHWHGFAYLLRGSLQTPGSGRAATGEGLKLEGPTTLNSTEGARAFIALGQPHGEPIMMRGPYVD
ncbi:MAG: pirin family protein, partial [Deinococcota bacterium]